MSQDERAPRRKATLADVAKRAGVSPALASIVLRDAPGASESSRARVLAAARHLDYRPDVRAKSLASARSRLIGVLFGRAGRFHFELIDGLYVAAQEQGWDLVLSALTPSRDERRAIESLHDFRFDALIMLGPPVAAPLLAGEVPVVVIGWHVDDPAVDVVRTSAEQGMELAVGHLAELGHRRITHLQGGDGLVAHERREGYERAMRAHGLERHIRVVVCDGEDQIDGQRATAALLDRRAALPTGIVAFNDDLAAAALSVLRQHGVGVPEEVSVVGFDDSALAQSPAFDLTSVTQAPGQMARLAVARVVARCEGRSVADREMVLVPELRRRATTARAPARR